MSKITISSRRLKHKRKEEQAAYEKAVRILLETDWEYSVVRGEGFNYNYRGLRDSILEGWDNSKLGLVYRGVHIASKDPYQVYQWVDEEGDVWYQPLTVHRTIVLMALPEMEIEVLLLN